MSRKRKKNKKKNIFFSSLVAYLVGVSRAPPSDLLSEASSDDHGTGAASLAPAASTTALASEKPLEWTPVDGSATSTSPAAIRVPSTTSSFFTAPTAKPATS